MAREDLGTQQTGGSCGGEKLSAVTQGTVGAHEYLMFFIIGSLKLSDFFPFHFI